MVKLITFLGLVSLTFACSNSQNETKEPSEEAVLESVVDSVLYYRNNNIKTDYLSRAYPELGRELGFQIQIKSLEKELANGEQHIGWKMGGTTGDSSSFDPVFGYLLAKNRYADGEKISINKFPGKEVMIEGEVGFVFKQDFPNGVESMDELKNGIDYAVGAIEFAQSNAIGINNDPKTVNLNHTLAFGMGQAGTMFGTKEIPFEDFDIKAEEVECFLNGESAIKGGSSRIYGGHLNALNALVNMLPKYGHFIRKGDIVITGSMYVNPIVISATSINQRFNSLGELNFEIVE